jgi:hypothetical protein
LPAPQGQLKNVTSIFSRLEDLSHLLVWTKAPIKAPNEPCSVDVVELPRLGLTFRSRESAPGEKAARLYCDDYDGWVK